MKTQWYGRAGPGNGEEAADVCVQVAGEMSRPLGDLEEEPARLGSPSPELTWAAYRDPGADMARSGRSSRVEPLELLQHKKPGHVKLPGGHSIPVW